MLVLICVLACLWIAAAAVALSSTSRPRDIAAIVLAEPSALGDVAQLATPDLQLLTPLAA